MSRIINADDFGMSKEINEAIVLAFNAGAITNASIILGPEKNHAIILAKKHKIPCGIHLHKKGSVYLLFLKSLFSKSFRNQLEHEFEKQILEIKKGVGIEHIDSHQHIHMFPPIFDIVARLARKYNLRLRISKSIDISPFNKLGLVLFYPRNRKKALKYNLKTTDSYETGYQKLNKLISEIKSGEIIVHPSIKNGKNFPRDKCITRRKELDILLNLK